MRMYESRAADYVAAHSETGRRIGDVNAGGPSKSSAKAVSRRMPGCTGTPRILNQYRSLISW